MYLVQKMNIEALMFEDTGIEKRKFYFSKIPARNKNVDTDKIIKSNRMVMKDIKIFLNIKSENRLSVQKIVIK